MERTTYFFPLMVLFLCYILPSPARNVRNITTDQAALLSLKAHITLYPHLILHNNWSTSSSVCDWIGVTCGLRHHRVTALNISNMNVTGTLPAQLGNLSFLALLDLSGNNFHGNLPEGLATLHRLRLMLLNYNSFSGQIPTWFGSFSQLRQLSLIFNNFTAFIPPTISNLSKLEILELSSNSLQGKIPPEIFSISTLEIIRMGRNMLSGDLPNDTCHNLPRLKLLALAYNALGGQIPLTLSNCSELRILSLAVNQFSGVIPGEIGKLENLEELYLAENGFSKGVIPQEIGNLRNLKMLAMQGTQLRGFIPRAIFNLSALQSLDLCHNDLEGEIPEEIGNLYRLEEIYLCNNSLSGSIPIGIFNLSNLRILALRRNRLVGTLPSRMGFGLPYLEELVLSANNLGGVIPSYISNSTGLQVLQLNDNGFVGEIPDSLGDLRFLKFLRLDKNNLTSPGLRFITSLTKCQYLKLLEVNGNNLDGNIPVSIGNLSALEKFYADDCKIRGSIPNEFGNISTLIALSLSDNYLTGQVPTTMKAIQVLDIANNSIQGSTLYTLCELQNLFFLNLEQNNMFGPIPDCLGNVTSLQYLYLYNAGLTSTPSSFWNLKNLIELDLSSNSLNHFFPPGIGNLKVATKIDLSNNQLSGGIPNVFADLSNLQSFFLSHNRLGGSIPDSLGKIISLEDLDLSYNNLSGSIPESLEALKYLKNFNVSFNNLRGKIPSNGPFKSFTSQSFEFNNALCGDSRFQVPPCPVSSTNKGSSKRKLVLILIPLSIVVTTFAIVFTFLLMRTQRKHKVSSRPGPFSITALERISYYELLKATDKYSESNLLGSGSFGSVYKGVLKSGVSIAIKVFNLQLEGAYKSFETECQVLRNLRHRNLTKVITSCCTEDFKALVLEYMTNGSLEKWLFSEHYLLNFMQRLNIMIDVACALEYLHHGYSTPLVHCDLKPSNVLLDEDIVAHVTDFGIAKLLGEGVSISHTNTLATFGYIAPEYGLQGLVSTKCDVYSFGIMMMEVFTRKKPSDEMFTADLSLKHWVSNSTPHAVIQVVDANLILPHEQHFAEKLKCLSSIMELALSCSMESPNERINMKDVVATLKKIKLEFLAYCRGI